MGNFEELRVWQRSKDLSIRIYRLTTKGPLSVDFGLRDQIRRAAISIVSNIAEGDELGTDKLATRHFYIAKGSSAELYTQLLVAGEIEYLDKEIIAELTEECKAISSMLHKLILKRKT